MPAEPRPSNIFYVSGRASDHLGVEQAKLESDRVVTYVMLKSAANCAWYTCHFSVLFVFPRGQASQGEPMHNLPTSDDVLTGWTWEQHIELTPFLEHAVDHPGTRKPQRGDRLPDLGPSSQAST